MLFHEWVAEQLAKIEEKDYIEPEYEMDPNRDHFLGYMSDDLKKLFTLWRKTGQAGLDAAKKAILELPAELEKVDMKKLGAISTELSLHRKRENALREAFWVSVRDELQSDKPTVAVCKGFKVAWSADGDESPPFIMRGVIIPFNPASS